MMTRQQLAAALLTVAPRTAQMVEAVLQAEESLEPYEVGVVELHFTPGKVQSTLRAMLGCYKLDRHIKRA